MSNSPNASEIVSRLNGLGREELENVRVTILKGHEPEIVITEVLAQMIGLEQLRPWNRSTSYKIRHRHERALEQGRSRADGPQESGN